MPKTATAKKPVDHFTEAMSFAEDYMAKEVQKEIDSAVKSDGAACAKLEVDIAQIAYEMHCARDVVDFAGSEEEEIHNETIGFEAGIIKYMQEKGYYIKEAKYSKV